MNNPRICPGTFHEWKNVAVTVTFIFPNFGGYSTPASPACMISLTRCSLHLRICKGSSQMTCQSVTPTIPGHHANSSRITGTCPKAAATCKALCPRLTATWIPPRFDQKSKNLCVASSWFWTFDQRPFQRTHLKLRRKTHTQSMDRNRGIQSTIQTFQTERLSGGLEICRLRAEQLPDGLGMSSHQCYRGDRYQ